MQQIKFCRHKSLRFYPPFVFITTFRAWIRCTPSDLSSSFQAKPLVLFFSSLVIILLSGKHELSPYLCPYLPDPTCGATELSAEYWRRLRRVSSATCVVGWIVSRSSFTDHARRSFGGVRHRPRYRVIMPLEFYDRIF